MPLILHKFRDHLVDPKTEILILGTFNPDIPEGPTFFYGRPRNFLWQLLPFCWGLPTLKLSTLEAKFAFMASYRIDFSDIISSVEVPADEEANVDDVFIDPLVVEWKNISDLIDSLPSLKAVYFTRKTFQGIPNIRRQVIKISNHCNNKKIRFCLLLTPSRYTNAEKQTQWINTIVDQNTCEQP